MVTKRNLIGILIAAFISLVGLILVLTGSVVLGNLILNIGGLAAFFFGIIMLLAESKIVGTIYWKIIIGTWILSHAAYFLTLVPEINPIPFLLGILVIYFGTYSLWFFKKESKKHLDYLKLFWVFSATLIPIGVSFDTLPKELLYCADILLWVMIADFLFIAFKNKKLIVKNKV